MMISVLFLALSLGLIGGVIPGPVLTAVFTEIVRSGFRTSIRIILISFTVESLVAVITLLLMKLPNLNEDVFYGLSFAGAIVLVYIATRLWQMRNIDTGERRLFGPGRIILMILTNGMLWIYWLSVCIPQAVLLGQKVKAGEYLFMILVQAGWLVSTTLTAWIFSRFRPLLSNPRIIPWMYRIFAMAFVLFAFLMGFKSIRWFL